MFVSLLIRYFCFPLFSSGGLVYWIYSIVKLYTMLWLIKKYLRNHSPSKNRTPSKYSNKKITYLYLLCTMYKFIFEFYFNTVPAGVISKSPGSMEGWWATWVESMPTESCKVAILFSIGLSRRFIRRFRSSFVAAWNLKYIIFLASCCPISKAQ